MESGLAISGLGTGPQAPMPGLSPSAWLKTVGVASMWALQATDAIARLTSKTTQSHDFVPFGDQIIDGDTQVRGTGEDGLGVLLEVLQITFYFGFTTSAPFRAAAPSRAGLAQPTIPRSCHLRREPFPPGCTLSVHLRLAYP